MAAFIVTFIDDLDLDVDGAQTEDGADGMVGTIFTMENRWRPGEIPCINGFYMGYIRIIYVGYIWVISLIYGL